MLKFFIALIFSACAVMFLPHYAQISELDDVYAAGLTVIPSLVISVAFCFVLIRNRSFVLSFSLTAINTAIAFLAIYITRHAAWEFLSSNNSISNGKVDYTSFHLFLIGIIPAILTSSTWIYMIIKMAEQKKNK